MSILIARPLLLAFVLALAGALSPPSAAQSAASSASTSANAPHEPAAAPQDVESMDAILNALYDVISGPQDEKRDWNRLRSLFAPGARVIPTHSDKNGIAHADVMNVAEFIDMAAPVLAKEGFYERESHRTVQRYGAIAHVFSTYESRRTAADKTPFQRGINSIQLLFDGHRWWVVTIYWQIERADLPVPKSYGG